MRPWTVREAARARPAHRFGFNGATALRPWTGLGSPAWSSRPRASMGPRPCGRGRPICQPVQHGPAVASMGPRPCGRGRAACRTAHHIARSASMGPRPCGRGRSQTRSVCRCGTQASMGPRPCGRGRLPVAWRRRWRGCRASMGPRPCGRGRSEWWTSVTSNVELQWGHGLAAVDGCSTLRTRP